MFNLLGSESKKSFSNLTLKGKRTVRQWPARLQDRNVLVYHKLCSRMTLQELMAEDCVPIMRCSWTAQNMFHVRRTCCMELRVSLSSFHVHQLAGAVVDFDHKGACKERAISSAVHAEWRCTFHLHAPPARALCVQGSRCGRCGSVTFQGLCSALPGVSLALEGM